MTTRRPTLPVPVPVIEPEASPYWDAAANGDLVVPYCRHCQQHFWYPRGFCPMCGQDDVEWRASRGRGAVYSFSVVRRAVAGWRDSTPYVVALITLAEGPIVAANVVGEDALGLSIGDQVTAVFERDTDASGAAILRFERSADSRSGDETT